VAAGLFNHIGKIMKKTYTYAKIIKKIKSLYSRRNVEGMARYGIDVKNAYGVPIPVLRKMAKETGKNHALALRLWESVIHEARLLAGFIDEPAMVDEVQAEKWAAEFDSWDLCDQCCGNLFDRTAFAEKKAAEWPHRGEEFVKRAGFVLMAALAVHDKNAGDELFLGFLPVIIAASSDDRNYVRKSVNWALRQIGKRNAPLNRAAIKTAMKIRENGSKSARWIASDALRELNSPAVKKRLKAKS